MTDDQRQPGQDEVAVARALAEAIVADLRYLVLATADATGAPWSAPVYFASRGLAEFFWVSRATSTHSVNLAQRPDVSLVVFDSRIAVGAGRGVYVRAVGAAVPVGELAAALEVYSRRSVADGAGEWSEERLRDTGLELYRARTTEVSVLTGVGPDLRVPLPH